MEIAKRLNKNTPQKRCGVFYFYQGIRQVATVQRAIISTTVPTISVVK
jgi:hypothetical protein